MLKIRKIKEDLENLSKKYMANDNSDGDSWTYEDTYARLSQFFYMKAYYGLAIFDDEEALGLAFGFIYNLEDKKYYSLEEILIFGA